MGSGNKGFPNIWAVRTTDQLFGLNSSAVFHEENYWKIPWTAPNFGCNFGLGISEYTSLITTDPTQKFYRHKAWICVCTQFLFVPPSCKRSMTPPSNSCELPVTQQHSSLKGYQASTAGGRSPKNCPLLTLEEFYMGSKPQLGLVEGIWGFWSFFVFNFLKGCLYSELSDIGILIFKKKVKTCP